MRSITSPTILSLLSSLLIDFSTASCAHNTFLHQRKLNYKRSESSSASNETIKTVEVGQFGYIGATGPTNWANLSPDNIDCATSSQQSPIDVTNTSTTIVPAGQVKVSIPNLESAEFENIGTTVEVVMEGLGGKMSIPSGKEFELKQFHFHSPSEHTIDGEYFPLEMHMVHQAEDSSLSVLAVLFSLSTTTTANPPSILTQLLPTLPSISSPGTISPSAALNFTSLLTTVSAQDLHYYNGSLTTPPCRAGLEFFITSKPLELGVEEFNAFKGVLGFNSRFTQNVVGRENLLGVAAQGLAAVNVVEEGEMVEGISVTITVSGNGAKVERVERV